MEAGFSSGVHWNKEKMNKQIIIYNANDFIVSQCATCDIPGYVIIETKQNVKLLHEISPTNKMFEILATVEKKIYRIIQPENIYFAKFGEKCKKFHFHVFPRTKEITERYLEQFPNTKDLNGPQIFDWARREYKVNEGCLSQKTIDIAEQIRIHQIIL